MAYQNVDTNLYTILWHVDQYGNKVYADVQNEPYKIAERKILLHQIPDSNFAVFVTGMGQIPLNSTISSPTQFKVDYANCIVHFHESLDGSTVNISYKTRGLYLINGKRVAFDNVDTSILANTMYGAIKEMDDRVNNIVSNSGTSNQEIVDARYSALKDITFTTLKDRMDDLESINKYFWKEEQSILSGANSFTLTNTVEEFMYLRIVDKSGQEWIKDIHWNRSGQSIIFTSNMPENIDFIIFAI